MKTSPDQNVRQYHAKTGPVRLRIHDELQKGWQLREPLRTKFILHILGQISQVTETYPNWFKQACCMNIDPYKTNLEGYYSKLIYQHNRELEGLLDEMVVIYNDEQHSVYAPRDFSELSLSPGVRDLLDMHQAALGSPDTLQTFGICHYELEKLLLSLDLELMEIKAGTEYFTPITHFRGLTNVGRTYFDNPKTVEIGLETLNAFCQMIETAYARSV
jgi:hypothetical protein